MINIGLLILRLVLGLIFIAHGGQKLFGWFGGAGLKATLAGMGRMGMRPAWLWGTLAGLSEFGGGCLVALGFLNPLGSLGIIAAMLVAIVQVHWSKGFFNTKGGFEFPLINLITAFVLGLVGPGRFSLDAILRIALPEPAFFWGGLLLVILAVIVEQSTRSHPAVPAPQAKQHNT